MRVSVVPGLIILMALLITANSSVYQLGEWQQAIVTQFGRIVGKPVTTAGLHFKTPFIQDVRYFDKRILNWDGEPAQVPTRDKKFIFVDTSARWRIADSVSFLQTVQSEEQALRRISSIIDGKTKTIISNFNLVDTVRNTNRILENLDKPSESENTIDEKITGEIEKIEAGREKISQLIAEEAQKEVGSLGIQIVDVLITRISYEKSVEAKVFERMISERNRIAEKIRSIGKGEEAKIRGRMDLELKSIESEAYRQSQAIRGKAEGEAIAVYAGAMQQDTDFYHFIRTLEAYKLTMPGRANLVLNTDSEFFRLLKDAK